MALFQTHVEDAVEDRLEDDDVAVAGSFWKLLLLLNVLLFVVDELVVLLRHPARVYAAETCACIETLLKMRCACVSVCAFVRLVLCEQQASR